MRISREHFGHRSGSASHTFLIKSRRFLEGMRRGSWAETFSGGQHAEVQQGRIESLTVGDWTVKNLPVVMLPLRQLSEGLGAKQIDGIIGTTLFYHFLATLDFPHGELVLRRKNATNLEQFVAASGKSVAVPFWIASDHFMVGWGRVETLPPALLFVDTGLAGAGVKLAESVIKEAGIKLEEDKASAGAGGGGKLKIVPYVVHRLSFGQVQEENVAGLYDGPFPWENLFGFHLAGMVGHDFFKPYAVTLCWRQAMESEAPAERSTVFVDAGRSGRVTIGLPAFAGEGVDGTGNCVAFSNKPASWLSCFGSRLRGQFRSALGRAGLAVAASRFDTARSAF